MEVELTAEVYKENNMFVVKIYEKKMVEEKRFNSYAEAVHYIDNKSEEL